MLEKLLREMTTNWVKGELICTLDASLFCITNGLFLALMQI